MKRRVHSRKDIRQQETVLKEEAVVYRTDPKMGSTDPAPWSHPWLDQLGLRYHEAIAAKLRAHPALRKVAVENIDRWLAANDYPAGPRRALLEWREALLHEPLETLLERMLDPSERGHQRRQNTPFAGILTDVERKAIREQYEQATTH